MKELITQKQMLGGVPQEITRNTHDSQALQSEPRHLQFLDAVCQLDR